MKTTIISWLFAPFLLINFNSIAQSTAVYDISFTSTWNSTDHGTLPPSPHWSDLVGCNHKNSFTLWKDGAPASLGVKRVAELGVGDELLNEINNGITDGTVQQWLQASFSPFAAISTATISDVEINSEHPLISVISMIAPSPDWFIGLEKISLLDNLGEWKDSIIIDVYPWDAGTDSGSTYTAVDFPTNPPSGIFNLQGIPPFSNEKIGTFTISLKSILSIDELKNNSFSLFPNPVENNLTISDNNSTVKSVAIYDLLGQKVKEFNSIKHNIPSQLFNLEDLDSGLYLINILTKSGQRVTKKIFKK